MAAFGRSESTTMKNDQRRIYLRIREFRIHLILEQLALKVMGSQKITDSRKELLVITLELVHSWSAEEIYICSICLEYFEVSNSNKGESNFERPTKLPKCGHVFHFNCISGWAKKEQNQLSISSSPSDQTVHGDSPESAISSNEHNLGDCNLFLDNNKNGN